MDEKPLRSIEDQSPSLVVPVGGTGLEEQEPASADVSRVVPIASAKKSKRPLYIILGIVFVIAVCCGVYFTLHLLQKSVVSSSKPANTTTSQQTSSTATTVTAQDAAIDASLNDIDSTLTQTSSDQAQTDTAMSDSEQQITVPTE